MPVAGSVGFKAALIWSISSGVNAMSDDEGKVIVPSKAGLVSSAVMLSHKEATVKL